MSNSPARGPMMLAISDGSVFRGNALGAEREAVGLVVFNTSMTGYEEMLTDPSYGGQILVPTYPIMGNYGINLRDAESERIQVQAFVVRDDCDAPSHPYARMTLHDYLLKNDVPGISGIDTRSVTRKIRSAGVMMGIVMPGDNAKLAQEKLARTQWYGDRDWVKEVAADAAYEWRGEGADQQRASEELNLRAMRNTTEKHRDPDIEYPLRIAVVDFGVKHNILRSLRARGCSTRVFSADVTADEIRSYSPDGIVLSPGPGDPALLDKPIETIRQLADLEGDGSKSTPMLAICLGHQLVARAMGAETFMLHFGHRGGNQPVLDIRTGRVYVTAHNHGYAVDRDTLPKRETLQVTHINLNDGTVEGLADDLRSLMTIQFHSEASPGPHDSEQIFDDFVGHVRQCMSSSAS